MAPNMRQIAKRCFPNAGQVIDRFHVQRLALEALQNIRIKYRWEAIEQENTAISIAKKSGLQYQPELFSNGDTLKQLLARSRYALYRSENKWTDSQRIRAQLVFEQYPILHKAYKLCDKLRQIYNQQIETSLARTKLAQWYNQVELAGLKEFNTLAKTICHHHNDILNYFINRSTNASAESFNAKVKEFRTRFRGVKSNDFFLFRLTKLFA